MTIAIGEIIKNGVMFDVKNWNSEIYKPEDLPATVASLFALLESRNIRYLVVGAVALLSYVAGRNTQNIDFILTEEELAAMPEITARAKNRDVVRGLFKNLHVTLLLTNNPFFAQVRKNYTTERMFGEQTIRCVTVEGLLLLKLYALPSLYRQRQFDKLGLYECDITILLLNYPALKPPMLLKVLVPHLLATELQEIQASLNDIQGRLNRFKSFQA